MWHSFVLEKTLFVEIFFKKKKKIYKINKNHGEKYRKISMSI